MGFDRPTDSEGYLTEQVVVLSGLIVSFISGGRAWSPERHVMVFLKIGSVTTENISPLSLQKHSPLRMSVAVMTVSPHPVSVSGMRRVSRSLFIGSFPL